jgi:23S rRNA (cytidine1920-2'-O)/16S rRNA (cytidine1409-2'-O)-methyltransferase
MVHDHQGRTLDKPGVRIPENTVLDIRKPPQFVSRGGEKLDAALEAFNLDVTGRVAIDVGASTGGFTDCLLQRGARRVYAVDVGYGQLAWQLRNDARVVVMERTNIRHLEPQALPERPDLFTVDCSFISLLLVLPPLQRLLAERAEGVALIKPQFEAGRDQVGKGGVVRDPDVRDQVVQEVLEAAANLGFRCRAMVPSPLRGPAGNREFLAYLDCG